VPDWPGSFEPQLVNAGHDLNQENLAKFLTIPDVLEVSIG